MMDKKTEIVDFDEKMKEVNAWITKQGLDIFQDSDFVVNGLRKIGEETLEIDAFVNIYLTNEDLFSAQITFKVLKR